MRWNDQFASQHGEDRWLCDHWANLHLPDYGFFVEFGAGDGIYLSNTYWLEKYRGWHGILCEPDPRNEITDRPNSIIERVAIGPAGTVMLGRPHDSYLSGALRTEDHDQEVVRALDVIEVPSVPLTDILIKHGIDGIDVISIDTEGTELEAWRTINIKRWRPRVAIIELVTWGLADESESTIAALNEDGYKMVHQTKHNGIFVAE